VWNGLRTLLDKGGEAAGQVQTSVRDKGEGQITLIRAQLRQDVVAALKGCGLPTRRQASDVTYFVLPL